MKRFISAVIAVVVFSASIALAQDDINIDIDNTNNVTATGGNASSDQDQNQGQEQGQEQKQEAVQTFNNLNRREHITAQPGPNGNFVNIPPIIETEVFLPYFGMVYTVEELGYIRDSASYADRPGFWSFMTSPVKRTLHMKRYSGRIDINASIELVDMSKVSVVKTLGVYHGTGAYGYPMEAILAYTLLQAKEETNASYYQVTYKTRKNPSVSGFAIGSGAASSLISGGANDRAAGSLSVGAVIGSSTAFIGYAFDVEVRAVVVSRRIVTETPVAYIAPPPPAPVCNPSEFLKRIEEAEDAIFGCKRYSHFNMVEQLKAAENSVKAWICTKQVSYLYKAIEHYQMAELNSIHGHDIRKYSDSAQVISEVEYGLASAFYARDGHINNYWKAPKTVTHQNKKTKRDTTVKTTTYERREILKIRNTLERYSKELTL